MRKSRVLAGIILMSVAILAGCGKKNNIDEDSLDRVAENVTDTATDTKEESNLDTAAKEENEAPAVTEATTELEDKSGELTDTDIIAIYQPVLDGLSTGDLYEGRYQFIYLNDDDIPEMAVSMGVSPADGVCIYGIIDKAAKKLNFEEGDSEALGSDGHIVYAEGKGDIEFGKYSFGRYDGWVVNWDGKSDKLALLCHRYIEYDAEMVPLSYNIDDKQVCVNAYYAYAQDALSGNKCNIDYYGCNDAKDDCNEALKKSESLRSKYYIERLKETTKTNADIEDDSFLIYDFDNDGIREMFVIYEGNMWFVTDTTCEKLSKEGPMEYEYIDSPRMIDCGGAGSFIYAYTDRIVTTLISDMWTVENGKAVSGSLTGVGSIGSVNNVFEVGDFSVIFDSYDATYIENDDMFLGHTWKPYFFNYGREGVKAYKSSEINEQEIAECCGFDLCRAITDDGNIIDKMAIYENGIIVVNYHRTEVPGEIDYCHMMWDIYGGMHGEGGYYGADNGEPSRYKEYEQDGIYGIE